MPLLEFSGGEVVYYEHAKPAVAAPTFVFVNALTGNISTWEHDEIGPRLRPLDTGRYAGTSRRRRNSAPRHAIHASLAH